VAPSAAAVLERLAGACQTELSNDFANPKPHLSSCPDLEEVLKDGAILKHRDLVSEAAGEYQRRGNFVRIFPAKNSCKYD